MYTSTGRSRGRPQTDFRANWHEDWRRTLECIAVKVLHSKDMLHKGVVEIQELVNVGWITCARRRPSESKGLVGCATHIRQNMERYIFAKRWKLYRNHVKEISLELVDFDDIENLIIIESSSSEDDLLDLLLNFDARERFIILGLMHGKKYKELGRALNCSGECLRIIAKKKIAPKLKEYYEL